jgi:hypothetical protein
MTRQPASSRNYTRREPHQLHFEGHAEETMDHLDKLDYAFLSFCVAAFLFSVIAIWLQKPLPQIEAQQIKGSGHERKRTSVWRHGHR